MEVSKQEKELAAEIARTDSTIAALSGCVTAETKSFKELEGKTELANT